MLHYIIPFRRGNHESHPGRFGGRNEHIHIIRVEKHFAAIRLVDGNCWYIIFRCYLNRLAVDEINRCHHTVQENFRSLAGIQNDGVDFTFTSTR